MVRRKVSLGLSMILDGVWKEGGTLGRYVLQSSAFQDDNKRKVQKNVAARVQ